MFKVHRKKKQHRGIRKYRKGRVFKIIDPERFPCASLDVEKVEQMFGQPHGGITEGLTPWNSKMSSG